MRVLDNYQPRGDERMPKKAGSKKFVTRMQYKAIKKQERQNRRAGHGK